ncbi:hypothetical protein [Acidihalobacter aeolianus]|uniref:hypothetical protein n=1 Tax=Acidihalobacter aeolianus TaxID=2792603 RepID=UPI0012EAEB07|nr:hypothetical protein [Acidihalobacter aeolianus]
MQTPSPLSPDLTSALTACDAAVWIRHAEHDPTYTALLELLDRYCAGDICQDDLMRAVAYCDPYYQAIVCCVVKQMGLDTQLGRHVID